MTSPRSLFRPPFFALIVALIVLSTSSACSVGSSYDRKIDTVYESTEVELTPNFYWTPQKDGRKIRFNLTSRPMCRDIRKGYEVHQEVTNKSFEAWILPTAAFLGSIGTILSAEGINPQFYVGVGVASVSLPLMMSVDEVTWEDEGDTYRRDVSEPVGASSRCYLEDEEAAIRRRDEHATLVFESGPHRYNYTASVDVANRRVTVPEDLTLTMAYHAVVCGNTSQPATLSVDWADSMSEEAKFPTSGYYRSLEKFAQRTSLPAAESLFEDAVQCKRDQCANPRFYVHHCENKCRELIRKYREWGEPNVPNLDDCTRECVRKKRDQYCHFPSHLPRRNSPQTQATPPSPSDSPAPSTTAKLHIASRPTAKVIIDGEEVGFTPLLGHELSPGTHRIELVNEKVGLHKTYEVDLKPGESERIINR